MKIKFLPQFLIDTDGQINRAKINITKEYKVRDDVTTDERLLKIKDDIFEPFWIPYEYEGEYFIIVEEDEESEATDN